VGTFAATKLLEEGHRVWATTTTAQKHGQLAELGAVPMMVNFDDSVQSPVPVELTDRLFDLCIISVPIARKDVLGQVRIRFTNLLHFLDKLQVNQLMFFGSVGIYPK